MIAYSSDGYLNPEEVRAAQCDDGDTEVRIYTNGLYPVCPDPRDESRVSHARLGYDSGWFICFDRVRINSADLPARG